MGALLGMRATEGTLLGIRHNFSTLLGIRESECSPLLDAYIACALQILSQALAGHRDYTPPPSRSQGPEIQSTHMHEYTFWAMYA
jgi:hypothetical protein